MRWPRRFRASWATRLSRNGWAGRVGTDSTNISGSLGSPDKRRFSTKTSFDVFHVDGERGLRGGERQLLYLAAALRARGHRNVVVCRKNSPLSSAAEGLGLEVRPQPFFSEWDPVTALNLARLAGEAKRPVLHAHTAHAAGLAALARLFGGPSPVVHRRVDFPLNGSVSRRAKYDSAGRIVAVSGAIRDILLESGVSPEKVDVVPDGLPVGAEECRWAGVDSERFAPPSAQAKARCRKELAEEFDVSADAVWIGNLAALVPHKDHETLIAAAMIVSMKRPKSIFLIAGEGPEEARLLDRIKKTNLLGKVLLAGQRDDPASFLKSLDIFVLSSWGEGMGSVLLEASACGVPIAATTAGGIPEIVEDSKSGLLAKPRDPEALAANIVRLIDDQALGRRLAGEASSRLPRFGLTRMAEEMERIYERIETQA